MHYEDVIVNSTSVKKKAVGTVYAAIKHAHRHGLNVKIKLPAAVKEIFRKPSDEERFLLNFSWAQIHSVFGALLLCVRGAQRQDMAASRDSAPGATEARGRLPEERR